MAARGLRARAEWRSRCPCRRPRAPRARARRAREPSGRTPHRPRTPGPARRHPGCSRLTATRVTRAPRSPPRRRPRGSARSAARRGREAWPGRTRPPLCHVARRSARRARRARRGSRPSSYGMSSRTSSNRSENRSAMRPRSSSSPSPVTRRDLERLRIAVREAPPGGRADAVDLVRDELDRKLARTDLGEHGLDRVRCSASSSSGSDPSTTWRTRSATSVSSSVAAKPSTSCVGSRLMKPTVSVTRYRLPSCSKTLVVGSSVSKRRFSTETSAPVSAFSNVDLPTFV